MKKRVIAVLLSILIGAGSMGEISAMAVETTAAEAMAVQEELQSEAAEESDTAEGENDPEQEVDLEQEEISDNNEQSDAGLSAGDSSEEILEDISENTSEEDAAQEEETVQEEDAVQTEDAAQTEETAHEEEDAGIAEEAQDEQNVTESDEVPEDSAESATVSKEAKAANAEALKAEAAKEVIGLAVDAHSQNDIRRFIGGHPAPLLTNTYDEEPSTTVPYSPGELSDRSTNAGFNALNQMRYVAGIPYEVSYDAEYTAKVQAAALVNAINGSLSHYPAKPEGMDDDLYNLACDGASSANIAMGRTSLADSVRLWMSDSDSNNIEVLGHRRWLLNPTMEKSGFGAVGRYSAVYAFDGSFESTTYSRVAWPAQNMPLEFWNDGDAWSVSFGKEISKGDVRVTLTRRRDGEVWTFFNDGGEGYFNVENSDYGQKGCVIFRPDNISYIDGDQFDVTISGADEADIAYTVNFFSLCGGDHFYYSEPLSEPTCTERGVTLNICENCGDVTYEYTPALGHNYKVVSEEGGVVTMKCDVCGDEIEAAVPTSFSPYWKQTGTSGSYWSYVPSGLEAGDSVDYLIRIDSYSAESGTKLDDMTIESNDPEHCIIESSGETTGTIRFTEAGDYVITIYPTYNQDCKVTRQVKIVKPVEDVSILTEPDVPLPYGSQIKLVALVDGGKGTLKYTFVAIDADGTETVIRNESTSATCNWKPGAAGTYGLRVDVKDTGDGDRVVSSEVLSYNVMQQPIRVKDNKEITAQGTLTYGQPLSELQVNNAAFVGERDNAAVSGSFSWETPDVILGAGTHVVNWIFTPDNSNYEAKNGSLSVEVKKATPEILNGPETVEADYHPNLVLADISLTGGTVKGAIDDIALGGSWIWTDGDTSLKVPGGTYSCRFVPWDEDNYETVETQANVEIRKVTPFIAHIESQEITYGQVIGDSVLTGTVQYSETDNTAVDGSFQWEDGTLVPAVSDSDTTAYTVRFVPDDTDNYETAEAQTTIRVKKAQAPSEIPPSAISVPYSTAEVSNEILRANGVLTWSFEEESVGRALPIGEPTSYTIVYTGEDRGNYEEEGAEITLTRSTCEHNGTVTVLDAEEPNCIREGRTGDTYCDVCGELIKTSVSIPVSDHSWDNGVITIAPQAGVEGVKTYTCGVCGATKTETVPAIILSTPVLSSVAAVKGGVTVKWNAVSGATKYRVFRKEGTGGWKVLVNTESNSYTDKTVAAGKKYSYTVRCLSKDGSKYASSYNTAGIAITYAATPALSKVQNIAGGVKFTFKKATGAVKYRIYKKTGSGKWIKLVDTKSLSYTDKKVKSGTKYTYTVRCISSDGKQFTSWYNTTGKYTVFATRPVISSVSSPNEKRLKVTWKKVSGITGYQIQFSKSKTFSSGNKTVTVKSKTAVSKIVGSLASKKKYYVRMRSFRTVNKKNYYSAWSASKNKVVK